MENNVLNENPGTSEAARAVDRTLAARRAAAADEVRRLIEAAFAVAERTGELEPRVSEILREAGLSNQAFYRHFRSKHELLVAVLDEGTRILAGYLEHRMDAASTPQGRVREWLRGILAQALDADAARATRPFALAPGRLAHAFPESVARSEERLAGLVRRALADAVAAGELPEADPERDAEALHLLAMGWLQKRLAEPGSASAEDAAALEAFALGGLARGGR